MAGASTLEERVTTPTLVIHGTADPMFPLAHGQALAESIPDATLLPIDGAGHRVGRLADDRACDPPSHCGSFLRQQRLGNPMSRLRLGASRGTTAGTRIVTWFAA